MDEKGKSSGNEISAAELAAKEKAWKLGVDKFNRIKAVKALEAALGTNAAFDLTRVFIGAQPGDYSSFGKKRAEQFGAMLNNLKSLNPDFQYKTRPIIWNQGKKYLEDGHRREIEATEKTVVKHYPDLGSEGKGDVLFVYYNTGLIKQQEELFGVKNLVDKVFNINEFLEIIAYAPILTPTRKLVQAHSLFGYYFCFPPCCIWDYPRSVQKFRNYLKEEYQMYLEHTPCHPECSLSINHSKLHKLAFELAELNLDSLRKEERKYFKGHLFFRASPSLFERMTKLADKYTGEITEDWGRYIFTVRSRENLSNAFREIRGITGVRNINTNTVLNKRH